MKQYWKRFADYMKQPATQTDVAVVFAILLICMLATFPWLFRILLMP